MSTKLKNNNSSRLPEDIFEPNNDKAIIVKNLVKKFEDVVAVNGLNFEIEYGETFGFLGPNGAGKTTTINILSGLLDPTEGTAIINGYDIRQNIKEIKETIGVCPQEPAVYKFLSAEENLELYGNLYTMPKDTIRERTDYLLDVMGLSDDRKRKTKNFSGGMIRRLSLILALISDPPLVFLDEPTVGMDVKYRRATWDFIVDLKKQNKTIILTTHYLEEAEKISDRIGIIDFGKLIAMGTPQELKKKYNADSIEEVFIKITGRKIREEEM